MTDTSKLDFAARQRIYDEEIAREKMFRTMFLRFQEGTPVEYFLNPFRGRKNNAVSDQVGGARGKKFLNKDEAFLRSIESTPLGQRSLSRGAHQQRRSASAGATPSAAAVEWDARSSAAAGAATPLPELAATRTPTPAAAATGGGGGSGSVIANNMMQQQMHHGARAATPTSPSRLSSKKTMSAVSPTPSRKKSEFGGYEIDEDGNVYLPQNTNLYDPTTSEGRSLLRMRQSNAVLKPRTQLIGEAIVFDKELKDAQRPPQDRYGFPRTAAQEVGWYNSSLQRVDRSPSAGGTRMSTGGYYLAKGLLTNTKVTNQN